MSLGVSANGRGSASGSIGADFTSYKPIPYKFQSLDKRTWPVGYQVKSRPQIHLKASRDQDYYLVNNHDQEVADIDAFSTFTITFDHG